MTRPHAFTIIKLVEFPRGRTYPHQRAAGTGRGGKGLDLVESLGGGSSLQMLVHHDILLRRRRSTLGHSLLIIPLLRRPSGD